MSVTCSIWPQLTVAIENQAAAPHWPPAAVEHLATKPQIPGEIGRVSIFPTIQNCCTFLLRAFFLLLAGLQVCSEPGEVFDGPQMMGGGVGLDLRRSFFCKYSNLHVGAPSACETEMECCPAQNMKSALRLPAGSTLGSSVGEVFINGTFFLP